MLGQRIKELRKNSKMTQQDLADRLNLAKSTISQYENNINEPDNFTMEKIADIFDVSIDYLLGRTDEKTPTTSNDEYNSIDEINKLVKQYGIEQMGFFDIEEWKNLSPDDVKLVEEHFKLIVKLAKERNAKNK